MQAELGWIDYSIIIGFFIVSLLIGILVSKQSGKSSEDFFLSGRNMPWWLLGVSMVATTFAADTPGLVTQIVRKDGVMGNWVWWSMLLTGTVTVFFYAKLWRRSGVTTDLEFYELRYSGKSAAFLRGFRAVYLGFFFNIVTMAGVCLAGAKIAEVIFDIDQLTFISIAGGVTVIYSMMGGLKGVLITDFFQFIMAMIGSVWATYYIVNMPEVGGVDNLVSSLSLETKNFLPSTDNWELFLAVFLIPIAVQWWSIWYPGAEPGGGGYIAQRMLAAKDEKHATWATLFFNFAHYALRPWPWILIGLASLVVFPDLESLSASFSHVDKGLIDHDAAYSAMISYLPAGLIGLVLASLIAAFMSTISTQLNWGSSYIVNDVYKRFINKSASEKQMVVWGRLSTLVLMIFAGALSFYIKSSKDFFDLLLQIGAGTGLLFILRWFWSRINPYSEITAMGVSFLMAIVFKIYNVNVSEADQLSGTFQLLVGVSITTISWVLVSLLTNPVEEKVLSDFNTKIFPSGNKFEGFEFKIIGFLAATVGIYCALFATGYAIYGDLISFTISAVLLVISGAVLITFRKKIFS
ncbi:MAG: Na+:solute symporter [Flavobacteriales bacterium]|nr:Na+:solute symporter [Flavobacteriales bacterium]MCB9196370.1 Na+:solute symporter [Flavobacteriales bacterium]MCB9198547.1 Na+:solute symporter [Flavobacteriales bacterium]